MTVAVSVEKPEEKSQRHLEVYLVVILKIVTFSSFLPGFLSVGPEFFPHSSC